MSSCRADLSATPNGRAYSEADLRAYAEFAARSGPRGQGVVWGQSGLGSHAKDERHYVPSIEPYYRALKVYGEILK